MKNEKRLRERVAENAITLINLEGMIDHFEDSINDIALQISEIKVENEMIFDELQGGSYV